jgi:hypothetical protein
VAAAAASKAFEKYFNRAALTKDARHFGPQRWVWLHTTTTTANKEST